MTPQIQKNIHHSSISLLITISPIKKTWYSDLVETTFFIKVLYGGNKPVARKLIFNLGNFRSIGRCTGNAWSFICNRSNSNNFLSFQEENISNVSCVVFQSYWLEKLRIVTFVRLWNRMMSTIDQNPITSSFLNISSSNLHHCVHNE